MGIVTLTNVMMVDQRSPTYRIMDRAIRMTRVAVPRSGCFMINAAGNARREKGISTSLTVSPPAA